MLHPDTIVGNVKYAQFTKREMSCYHRGHLAYNSNDTIRWFDNDKDVYQSERKCKLCNKSNIKDENGNEYDACMGKLPGVKFACCGHGKTDGYIVFNNLSRVILKKMTKQDLEVNGSFKDSHLIFMKELKK